MAGQNLNKLEDDYWIAKVRYKIETNPSVETDFVWYEVFVPYDDPDTPDTTSMFLLFAAGMVTFAPTAW